MHCGPSDRLSGGGKLQFNISLFLCVNVLRSHRIRQRFQGLKLNVHFMIYFWEFLVNLLIRYGAV